jgi:hypothetical protein
MSVSSNVHPVHFEDFDSRDFERLVFAFLLRTERWQSLDWYGQLGVDLGRDIWGVRDMDGSLNATVCIQCANHRRVPLAKLTHDIDCVVAGPQGVPGEFILVAGGGVSARLRDAVKKYAAENKIARCAVWSGPEFEERLRMNAETLLKRFVLGHAFPDAVSELRELVESLDTGGDEQILTLMASLFDRPAFYTPFQSESSIPAFKKAITDTIEALNTGIHRLRDGTEIRRIPSRHQIQSPELKTSLSEVERLLCLLRAKHDQFSASGDIRPCGCTQADCSVFFVSPPAAHEMDRLRMQILDTFHRIHPGFNVRLGWNQ